MTSKHFTYELSWAQDNHRIQAWFFLPEESTSFINDLFEGASQSLIMTDVQNLNFFRIQREERASPAKDLVVTLSDALGEDYFDWEPLRSAALACDNASQLSPDLSVPIVVEFVWENGGGDDNLFTDFFQAIPGSLETLDFLDELVRLEEEGAFYDFGSYNQSDDREGVSINDLISMAQNIGKPAFVAFLEAIKSADMRNKLSDILDVSLPHKAPHPKVKM